MSAAVTAYRNLLRAARLAFQGDGVTLNAARSSIRGGFRDKAALVPTSQEYQTAVLYANDVAMILRQNVVQGKRDGDKYRLRIHEETERGDNDTVKFAGKTLEQGGAKCCSS
ncbi:hypothetical protein F4861DRAFT_327573 [Xylaria intraflava]|nr:hypothetical protein F4861DRAFT_327573 [Xylaria intraflava]